MSAATDRPEQARAAARAADAPARRALVLGLGDSGLAMARWLADEGFDLRVADTRAEPPQRAALAAHCPSADFVGGALSQSLLDGVELVAISPGLAPTLPDFAALLKLAKTGKIEVVGEIELFARGLARLKAERGYAPKVVGVTGTNGKTTTTRLAGLARRAGRRRPARGLGARAVELPARHHAFARVRRRRRAQRHAGPPRLARHDGGVRRGQGAHLLAEDDPGA
jgi:UDP-N-acetylmuramoylalanine-D-glutamate ligase